MAQVSAVKRTTFGSNGPKNRVEIPVTQKPQPKADLLQKIQEKAYELFLQRNGAPGSAEQDWIQAEKIVKGL